MDSFSDLLEKGEILINMSSKVLLNYCKVRHPSKDDDKLRSFANRIGKTQLEQILGLYLDTTAQMARGDNNVFCNADGLNYLYTEYKNIVPNNICLILSARQVTSPFLTAPEHINYRKLFYEVKNSFATLESESIVKCFQNASSVLVLISMLQNDLSDKFSFSHEDMMQAFNIDSRISKFHKIFQEINPKIIPQDSGRHQKMNPNAFHDFLTLAVIFNFPRKKLYLDLIIAMGYEHIADSKFKSMKSFCERIIKDQIPRTLP